MMKSACDRSSILVVGERSERAESASDWEILCLETSFASNFSRLNQVVELLSATREDNLPANRRPLSSDAWEESTKVTGT